MTAQAHGPTQPNGLSAPVRAGQLYRSPASGVWPGPEELGVGGAGDPSLALWVVGTYASLADLYLVSIPEDSARDYDQATLRFWLGIGAAQINEHLGNRGWPVPLNAWSQTVVWANCELAFCGATRKRGVKVEGGAVLSLRDREAKVDSWLKAAQEREITPDPRPAAQVRNTRALTYIGDRNRGWDNPRGQRR